MRSTLPLGLVLLLAAIPVRAAEFANLRNGYSVRHEHHETMGSLTRLFLSDEAGGSYVDVATSQIESFELAPLESNDANIHSATTYSLSTIIRDASSRTQIDADFIASVIRAESANNPRAVSRKGAQGLMQLMPDTAKGLGVKDSYDPVENVEAGARFLRDLLFRYNGDAAKALAAYNAGPLRVQQYRGVPPYRETHTYITRVIGDYNRRKLAQRREQSQSAAKKTSPPAIKTTPIAHAELAETE